MSRRAYQRWKVPRNSREQQQQQQRANFFSFKLKPIIPFPQLRAGRKKKKIPSAIKNDFVAYVCVCVGRISLSSDERAPRLKFFPVAPTHLNQSHTVIFHPHFFFLFPPLEKFVFINVHFFLFFQSSFFLERKRGRKMSSTKKRDGGFILFIFLCLCLVA